MIQNKIHINQIWGAFIGKLNDNKPHKHYALQISISSGEKLEIIDKNNIHSYYTTCFINSNVMHQFKSDETTIILLINPISSVGHQLYKQFKNTEIANLTNDLQELTDIFNNYLQNTFNFETLIDKINNKLLNFKCKCDQENHFSDDRIYKAIHYLEQNFERVVSLKEIASICTISETRFLHLFKEKTALNFRRYQLWNKLIKSLPYLKNHSITATAHRYGFTDSSHYNRTFKETFGLSPKFLLSLK